MSFTHAEKSKIWNKANAVSGYDSKALRKDKCGAWIKWADYGDRDSDNGWEIDHITPVSKGGSDALGNLQALHWQNNVDKSDGRLMCPVSAT